MAIRMSCIHVSSNMFRYCYSWCRSARRMLSIQEGYFKNILFWICLMLLIYDMSQVDVAFKIIYMSEELDAHIFYPLFWKRGQYCLSLHWVEGFLVVDECDAEWDIIVSALLPRLVYDVDVVYLWVSASESRLVSWLVFFGCLL